MDQQSGGAGDYSQDEQLSASYAPTQAPATEPTQQSFPLTFHVEYKPKLDRLTTFFRIFTIIPVGVIVALLSANEAAVGSMLFVPLVLMLLFRKKYPRWWYDWNLQFTRFYMRVQVYLLLMRDEYPSTDEEQAVRLDFPYPDAEHLSRGLPLVKWFLAIPHWFLLFFLSLAALVCVVVAWFAILFTGVYPRSLFDFVEGVNRWWLRVVAYAILLITDEYPPFRLTP
ncbi:MAG: DUF4389 domain-containing protein [Thermoleophilia bacterium]|jgi:hypothetical protein